MTTPDTNPAVLADVKLVARTLLVLGGQATADQVATACGLSAALVVRRLKARSLVQPGKMPRAFSVVREPDYKLGKKAVWGLTSYGKSLAE